MQMCLSHDDQTRGKEAKKARANLSSMGRVVGGESGRRAGWRVRVLGLEGESSWEAGEGRGATGVSGVRSTLRKEDALHFLKRLGKATTF